MRITISILLFLLGGILSAQQVRMRVLDKSTRLPIAAAVVSYTEPAYSDKLQHSIADDNGIALLKKRKGGVLHYTVQSLGYTLLKGTLNAEKELTVYLSEETTQLAGTTLTGRTTGATVRPTKETPTVVQVITGQELVKAGYSNIQQALMQETPGMNIQKVGFGNEISMQGLDARHILFLMDGERMTGEMAGNLDYERFNLHAVERIEVMKGASSTLYGSRAAGAVINIITKKTDKPFTITVGSRHAEMNERNYHNPERRDFLYMFEKNADKPNLQSWVSAGAKIGKFTTQTDVWFSSQDAYYLYQKEPDRKVYTKEANPFLSKDTVVQATFLRPPMGIEGVEHLSASQKLYYDSKNLSVQLYGTGFLMNSYDMVQDLYFSQTKDFTGGLKLSYRLKNYFALHGTFHTDFYERYKRHERRDVDKKVYDSKIMQPRLTLTSQYFKKHDLILGIDYFQDDLTSDRFAANRMLTRGLKEWEFFFQDTYTISPKWQVEAGLRTNYSLQFGTMALPKVAIKFSPTEALSYRLNYAKGYRSPSIKELFFNWDHLGMFQIIGNEMLQPEKNHYFSVGAEYAVPKFFISGNAFINQFQDKIEGVWKIYEFQYNFEYMNLSQQRLLGFDLLTRWKIVPALTLNASYSYVDVSKTEGLRINTTSPHAATAGLEYKWYRDNYDLSANLTMSMMGKKTFDVQDRITVQEEVPLYGGGTQRRPVSKEAYFRCELPAYALFNLNVQQRFLKHYKLNVGANNIFDYKPSTLGSGVTMFNIPATAGRRFFVQVEIDF